MKRTGLESARAWLLGLVVVCGCVGLGIVMWAWALTHIAHDLDLERHGIRVSATVLADGSDRKNPSEQLDFLLPDGTTATEWSSAVSSQQAPGSLVAAVYLPGQPETVESAEYLRWWWVAFVLPPFGTVFVIAGLWLLWGFVGAMLERTP